MADSSVPKVLVCAHTVQHGQSADRGRRMVIYFAKVRLGEEVHAQALGFTKVIHVFVMAEDEVQVPSQVSQWCRKKSIVFDRVLSISIAHQQDPERYCFPEQIIGYDRPSHFIEAEQRAFNAWLGVQQGGHVQERVP